MTDQHKEYLECMNSEDAEKFRKYMLSASACGVLQDSQQIPL
jgi:hypothetical protein